jgi:hypothetical protein
MLGLLRRGLDTNGSGLRVSIVVSRGVGSAGDELNKTDDRSLDVGSMGDGFLLGVSKLAGSSLCALVVLVIAFDTSSVELVGD